MRRFDIPFSRDGSVRFLPWITALMVYLAGLAVVGVLLLHAALADWNRDLSGAVTVELPPAVVTDNDAAAKRAIGVLETWPGVTGATLVPRAAVAKLVEPWLGGSDVVRELALPRLIDVHIDPAHRPDLDKLRTRLTASVPGAALDDARLRFARLFDLGLSVELIAVAILALIALAAALTTIFTTRAGLAVHHGVIEILHILGARDSYIARQFARQALGLGLRGGVIGLILAAVTLAALGYVSHSAATLGPGVGLVPNMMLPPWQWPVLLLPPLAAAAIAYVTALATVQRALARMP
jgi:cell division transport system permease protein